MDKQKDRMLGCLYGQAIGDALGLGTEFMNKDEVVQFYPGGLQRYDQIIQDAHRRRWPRGTWTDDTDMMLCIMNGYDKECFNIRKVAENFKGWFNGTPMGIGSHTYKVLCMDDYVDEPEICSKLWWDLSRQKNAANGVLMRTSAVGVAHGNVKQQAEAICKLTHYDPRCIGSCVIASEIIHNLIWNNAQLTYEDILAIGNEYDERIAEWIDLAYYNKDIANLDLDEHSSMGYTLRTLSAALWCYWHAQSFEEGILSVVNEGGDADTNAAISGAILGAKFGSRAIPKYYIASLNKRTEYDSQVEAFIDKILH